MISTLLNILLFIFILGILIFVHEFGHFITAKKSGVYIHEFSIGMGPAIKTWKGKDGIDYSLRAFPIGGYVQMAGEIYEDDDTNTVPEEQFMCNRPWYQRLIILCAGVFNNFLLAIILLFAYALIWGGPSLEPRITTVEENSPAAQAGIQAGDLIVKINGKKVSTIDKTQLLLILRSKKETVDITVKHDDGKIETYEVTPKKEKIENIERRVIGVTMVSEVRKGFGNSIKYAFQKFASVIEQMWLTIKSLFTGGVSIKDLSGPVGIYTVVGETRKSGVRYVIYLIAYLSINLGLMNILPIPALDGGHVLFLLIELITRKKVNEKIESIVTTIFFALLMLLMIYVTIHDIIRFF